MRSAIGCLVIDELTPGVKRLSGLSCCLERAGIPTVDFACGGGRLLERLREAYYAARRGCEAGAVVGCGSGCWAALAIAEQLPAARLALIDARFGCDRRTAPQPLRAQLRRIEGFARRNLSFCVSEVLVVDTAPTARRRAIEVPNGRLIRARLSAGGERCPADRSDIALRRAIVTFLSTGDLPKYLAENPEMCIIYG